jgi:hypothetical protein
MCCRATRGDTHEEHALITAAGLFLAASPYAYALDITSEPDATITQQ